MTDPTDTKEKAPMGGRGGGEQDERTAPVTEKPITEEWYPEAALNGVWCPCGAECECGLDRDDTDYTLFTCAACGLEWRIAAEADVLTAEDRAAIGHVERFVRNLNPRIDDAPEMFQAHLGRLRTIATGGQS